MRLKGKVAIVTGASRGIGFSIAEYFIREGATVVISGREQASAQDAAKRLGKHAHAFAGDISREDVAKTLVTHTIKTCGRLDILVNNAGIYPRNPVEKVSLEEWQTTLAVNLQSPFLLAREASPALRKHNGCIINIASVSGIQGSLHGTHYTASKAGIIGLTKALAKELAPEVRVNAISPGPIESGMTSKDTQEKWKKRLDATPLKRRGKPEDIARVAVFLASDDAGFVTGQNIVVDGGLSLS